MSVLAAMGANILLSGEGRYKRVTLALWAGLALTGFLLFLGVQTDSGLKLLVNTGQYLNWERSLPYLYKYFQSSWQILFKPIILILATLTLLAYTLFQEKIKVRQILIGLALVLLVLDLIPFGLKYNTASPKSMEFPPTGGINFLLKDQSQFRVMTIGRFMHNSLSPFGIQDIGGYHSFYPKRYGEYLHLSQYGPKVPFPEQFNRWVNFRNFNSPLLDLINMKYILLQPNAHIGNKNFKLAYNGEIKIYENMGVFPRIFFVPSYKLASTSQDIYEIIASFSAKDFKSMVILEKQVPPEFQALSTIPGTPPVWTASLVSKKSTSMTIKVTSDNPGFLIIGDNYEPSWRATVDGAETPIFRANYIMRAIPVKAGNHEVVVKLDPGLFLIGLIIASAGWIFLALLSAVCFILGRTTHDQNEIKQPQVANKKVRSRF